MTERTEAITKELYIECRPETLFRFFTEPDKLIQWMGTNVLLDPTAGGKYRIDINGHDIAMGEYLDVVPFERIVMTWGWQKSAVLPPGSSTVTFQLSPSGNGTLLQLTHAGLPASEILAHTQGWDHYLGRIKQVGEGRSPGMDPWSVRK